MIEARYYEKLPHRKIRCLLCPRECVIDDLERGYCGVRENRGGTYYSLVYGKPVSMHIDPIEKKPLFHFLPGSEAFSIATVGCNVLCKFCQNWEISQARPEQVPAADEPPEKIARAAQVNRCASIAYTYNEPVIFAEYMYDIAEIANSLSVHSVMITNGYINAKPMRDLCRVLRAVKIDLKAFTERFYRELVAGELKPVLDTLILLKSEGMWTEIVYLVIPGQNDDRKELTDLSRWIMKELGPDTPVHFTRFHPMYRLTNLPSTPIATLQMARNIALDAGIHYVYTGNVPGDPGENTYCPHCRKMLIQRIGYHIVRNEIKNNQCPYCNTKIAGIWQ
ncbi:AmmeMemoRadiSam system radical SAM enzyme [candidate division KSB1 bacterium]|nr:AmmeMemoRadiSam system radical SAM enzyme [candidate division KSB1 bacterium]